MKRLLEANGYHWDGLISKTREEGITSWHPEPLLSGGIASLETQEREGVDAPKRVGPSETIKAWQSG